MGTTASRPQGSFSPILARRIRQLTLVVTISPTVGTEEDIQTESSKAKQGERHGATACGVRRGVIDTQARRRIVGPGTCPCYCTSLSARQWAESGQAAGLTKKKQRESAVTQIGAPDRSR